MSATALAVRCVREFVVDVDVATHRERPDELGYRGRSFGLSWDGPQDLPLDGPFRLVHGDDQDAEAAGGFLGNAAVVEVDPSAGTAKIRSSISGLPALHVCRHDRGIALATSVEPLLRRLGSRRSFDWTCVHHLGRTGRAAPGRTLFRGISLVLPGECVEIDAAGMVRRGAPYAPDRTPFETMSDYHAAQEDALCGALRRMDLSHTVLSLTGGLDTRAILAALLAERIDPPEAVTLCSTPRSIDVELAAALARAYGFAHTVVRLDSEYENALPELCEQASAASMGWTSYDQAPDLYLYRCLGGRHRARLSGFLGNQIGRGGLEGVTERGARLDVLGPAARCEEDGSAGTHWMVRAAAGRAFDDPSFLVGVESFYSSLANYTLGDALCTQRSPYADRTVITHRLREPVMPRRSAWRMCRTADLRHRFVGEPLNRSFQRRLIVRTGGFVSRCPVNWGWRPKGGMSPAATARGSLAFLDAALGVAGRRFPLLDRLRHRLGVAGLYELERVKYFQAPRMREFVRDTLSSQDVLASGVFDTARLRAIVDRGHDDPRERATVLFALDLALAWRRFLARPQM